MNPKVERVTSGLTAMVQPYLGRREYGNPELGNGGQLVAIFPGSAEWILMYQGVLHSTSGIAAVYDGASDTFEYRAHKDDDSKTRTRDPEDVLRHFKASLDLIKVERLEDLKKEAHLKKQKGVLPETAIADVRRSAEQHPKFGPTEEEVAFFAEYYRQICTQ